MGGSARTRPAAHEIAAVVLSPQQLRRTFAVALIVGTTFFAMNQLGAILAGHATATVWLKVAMTYLTPVLVANYGVVCALRRMDARAVTVPNND
jgi:hypothetical protein